MAASFRIPSNLLLSILSSELQTTPLNKPHTINMMQEFRKQRAIPVAVPGS
jgi:hypothetical protein